MSINKEKIKANIRKAIRKLPTQAIIIRYLIDEEFNEPTEEYKTICEIEGLYHEGATTRALSIDLQNKGEIKKGKGIYFLVVYEGGAMQIQKDDVLLIGDDKFIIKDLGNANRMDIYLDLKLEEVREDGKFYF